jgi:hypothetical protein
MDKFLMDKELKRINLEMSRNLQFAHSLVADENNGRSSVHWHIARGDHSVLTRDTIPGVNPSQSRHHHGYHKLTREPGIPPLEYSGADIRNEGIMN